MIDLELIKRCAEKMGVNVMLVHADGGIRYWPLTDDAQAMALVKRFRLEIAWNPAGWAVNTWTDLEMPDAYAVSEDLNRAICECCEKLP